jgi:hypothetical protein
MPRQNQGQSQSPPAEGNGPVHTIRHGRIRAAIWKNQTGKGATMYDVNVTRSYREGNGWRDSHSFGYDDILVVAKLLHDAHTFISALHEKERATPRSSTKRREDAVR